MTRAWLIVVAMSCSGRAREATVGSSTRDAVVTDGAVAPVQPPTAATRTMSVVELDHVWRECSGAGGDHASMKIAGGPLRHAHAGGHGLFLPFGNHLGPKVTTGWFVAELLWTTRPDDVPPESLPGNCLDGMPRFHAEVVRLWSATDRADATRQLAVAGSSWIQLAPVASTARLGVARVKSATDVVGRHATAYALESIAGDPFDTFEAPWPSVTVPFRPRVSELVVIAATANGVPTRVLVARDRHDADARAAALRGGWPAVAAPLWQSRYERSLEPGISLGEVIAGRAGCGDEVLIPPLVRVAAPAGAQVGDRVTMFLEPSFPDACGRTLRVLRAYVTPDTTDIHWMVEGPVPGRRLIE